MTLPRLRAELRSNREIARVFRFALRHELAFVPLAAGPKALGQHLLEIDVPGEGIVTLLADPAGAPTQHGYPLQVRPVTRPQMATLLALAEKIDVASSSLAPPPMTELDSQGAFQSAISDRTIAEPMVFSQSDFPPSSQPLSSKPVSLVPASPQSEGPLSLGPSSNAVIMRAPTRHADGHEIDGPDVEPQIEVSTPSSRATPVSILDIPVHAAEGSGKGTSTDQDDIIGRVIADKYRVLSLIGAGSTAAVYRAMHMDLGREVAVKILHEQNSHEKQFVQRFKGEARAASKLEHQNVARVLDFGQEKDGVLYLVMELLEGRSLEAILAAEGRISAPTAVDIALQTLRALAFAHDLGIIHRDVKPENLMLVLRKDDDGNPCDLVKVCDFGLAKLRDRDPDQQEDLTTAGMLCGSPAYMSPEQARGEQLDVRTDIYALGVTLFECLTGAMPHDGYSLVELFTKKMTEPPKKPSALVKDIHPTLEKIVLRAIATDPGSRQGSARELRDELRKIQFDLV